MAEDTLVLPVLGEVTFDFSPEFTESPAKLSKEPLSNVTVLKIVPREDDRGLLLKDIQSINLPKGDDGNPMFGEHYSVFNPQPMIRGFHAHRELWDYFCIVLGKAKFVLIDARKTINGEENPTYGLLNEYFLSDRNPGVLVVPPGIYHGWKSLVPNTLLSSTGTHLYDPQKPDEVRVLYTSFGYSWEVKIS
ncbi:MAG TPA: dTDP-4-dehydrorhamnose 3,5-epimerase family protein [Candidatus Lokiarchaeia archaeon]|nr:dTDP-4-dehydrorhamnose 3,5-epimerase family protein [Candidatus Lokiarchaeia archaeon]